MKKKKEINFVCPKCGKTPPKDKLKSNENWEVYPAECPDCKLYLKMILQ